MVKVSIRQDIAVFEIQGWHKLWAFKSRLQFPLAHIVDVRADPVVLSEMWKGLRLPGTYVPGIIIAGTYYKGGKRSFWDVRRAENAIVVELVEERYQRLVIEVADPLAAITRLTSATSPST